jgi:DNA-binding IclR family transcriptional regulator
MDRPKADDSIRIQATEVTFDIIECLLDAEGATLTELSTQLDIPKSTAFDYLQTLHGLGYIVKRDTTYHVSMRFLDIGLQVRSQSKFAQVAKSELQKLADETGEYASLVFEEHGQGVIVDTVGSEEATDIGIRPGTHVPLHASAGGKAILPYLPDERVEELLSVDELSKESENTITDPDRLREELREVEQSGYATNKGERREGTYAVAAPINRKGDRVASITVYGPAYHLREIAEESLPEQIMRSANIVEVTLNHS